MLTSRRTKIVATLGPASTRPDVLRELIAAGLDVARINGSHGDHATHAETIGRVREISFELGRPVGILFDLQGPKIRLGSMAQPREVAAGSVIELAVGREPEGDELPSDYPLLDQDVEPGAPLLIDDGNVATTVTGVEKGRVTVRVENDGVLGSRKGINLPNSVVSAPALSDKDRDDALFAAQHKVDLIALSFVRRPQDVLELREHLAQEGHEIPIIAKIEKPQALEALDGILHEVWGVMVARGDLGVELPPEAVPLAQKRIIRAANRLGKPVITATQMLDSMKAHPRPTRAEASDVANAVLDGSDAVMLSGETAVGTYPVESVSMMSRIIRATEQGSDPVVRARQVDWEIEDEEEAVADAACDVARHIGARAIVALTRTGASATGIARRRPAQPLWAFTPDEGTRNRLALVWGVTPWLVPDTDTVDARVRFLDEALLKDGLAEEGDAVVLCMASPRARAGATNIMMVHRVGAALPKRLPVG